MIGKLNSVEGQIAVRKWLDDHTDEVLRVGLVGDYVELSFFGILRAPEWYGSDCDHHKVGEIFSIYAANLSYAKIGEMNELRLDDIVLYPTK